MSKNFNRTLTAWPGLWIGILAAAALCGCHDRPGLRTEVTGNTEGGASVKWVPDNTPKPAPAPTPSAPPSVPPPTAITGAADNAPPENVGDPVAAQKRMAELQAHIQAEQAEIERLKAAATTAPATQP